MVSMRKYLKLATAVMAVMAALAVVSCNSWSPVQETDASKYELKGNVASFRTISYKVDSTADGYRVGAVDPMSQNIYYRNRHPYTMKKASFWSRNWCRPPVTFWRKPSIPIREGVCTR